MRKQRAAIALGVAAIAAGAMPSVGHDVPLGVSEADARPWTATYDWQGSTATGSANWVVDESIPGTGAPGPWYRTWLGSGAPATIGRGLGIQPVGGRTYDNGDPTKQVGGPGTILRWEVPGASTITQATFSQLRYRNENDDQYLRVKVATGTPNRDPVRDIGPAYGQSNPTTTYTPAQATLTPPLPGIGVEASMFTVCGPDAAAPPGTELYRCPDVPATTGTFGRVGRVAITLDDPDAPTLDVQSRPVIDEGWVNKRRVQKLQVTATDPSSGIQRIQVQLKTGSTTKTLADQTVRCDPLHTTADRGGLVCPPTATVTATDPGRDTSTTDRTYVITATDYAGNTTTRTLTVRRDLKPPTTGTLSGVLRQIAATPTGLSRIVPATVTGTDGQSGVARLEVLARRQTGGKTYVIGTADADCATGCPKRTTAPLDADLSRLPRDGRYRLQVRVTDQAGNQKTFNTGTLLLDRTAPSAPKAHVLLQPNGSARAIIDQEGRDPSESSGRGDYYLLYPAGTDSPDTAIRPGDDDVRDIVGQLRTRLNGPARLVRSKDRRFPLPGYRLNDPKEPGYVLQTDYARSSSDGRRVRIVRVGQATVRLVQERTVMIGAEIGSTAGPWGTAAGALVALAVGTYLEHQIKREVQEPKKKPSACKTKECFAVYDYSHRVVLPRLGAVNTAGREFRKHPRSRTLLGRARGKIGAARSAVLQMKQQAIRAERTASPKRVKQAWEEVHDNTIRWNRALLYTRRSLNNQYAAAVRQELVDELNTIRRRAAKTAKRIARRNKVGRHTCRDSNNAPGYIVYYGQSIVGEKGPDGEPEVNYVGITSRSLKARCAGHRNKGSAKRLYPNFFTFASLPPLPTKRLAEQVEQVLMEHWGIAIPRSLENLDTETTPDREPSLLNRRLNISGRRKRGESEHQTKVRYCSYVIRGAAMLQAVGYANRAIRHFPRRNCPR
jgi:hypothetical protein